MFSPLGRQRGGDTSGTAGSERRDFATWLRTGVRLRSPVVGDVELKFNPYHDPRDGRFTFAPGGARIVSRTSASTSRGRLPAGTADPRTSNLTFSSVLRGNQLPPNQHPSGAATDVLNDGAFHPNTSNLLRQTQYRPSPARTGGNIRAFQDPMTLQETFPGLRESPGGSMLALVDNIFDLTGPARAVTTGLSIAYSRTLIAQIKAVDPSYRFDSFGMPETLAGQVNQISDLRLDRAAAYYRKRAETEPLQVKTLRFIQKSTDRAYEAGVQLYNRGKLSVRLSREEAIGNFVDRQVRQDLREFTVGLASRRRGISRSRSTVASMTRPKTTAPIVHRTLA